MKTICYAYYGDGKFLGWYADSFGSIRRKSPKLYSNSEKQNEIIITNFKSKISRIKEKSDLAGRNASLIGLKIIDASINKDSSDLSQYKQIELRSVECPIYDGPNPDFDKETFEKLLEERTINLKAFLYANGVDWNSGPSPRRSILLDLFNEDNPRPKANGWIYADYDEVQKWAEKEPTEFINIITP